MPPAPSKNEPAFGPAPLGVRICRRREEAEQLIALYPNLARKVLALAADKALVDSRERHAADARDLDQLRVTVRDESQRAHDAEVLQDRLADSLEEMYRTYRGVIDTPEETGADRAVLGRALAALQAAGRFLPAAGLRP